MHAQHLHTPSAHPHSQLISSNTMAAPHTTGTHHLSTVKGCCKRHLVCRLETTRVDTKPNLGKRVERKPVQQVVQVCGAA